MPRVLLVDDEPTLLQVLTTLLEAEGYEVVPVDDGHRAVKLLHSKSERLDLMISDIRMTPVSGMEILKAAHEARPAMAVLMMTAFGSVETAVSAMKMGAFDYIIKPFKVDEMLMTVRRALEYNQALTENVDLKTELVAAYEFGRIVAKSQAMKQVCQLIERIAPTGIPVLIQGEDGSGRKDIAAEIHERSRRPQARMVTVDCGERPEPDLEAEIFGCAAGAAPGAAADREGVLETAAGGTVFLDRVAGLPAKVQKRLLDVIQDKTSYRMGSSKRTEVDVRLLAGCDTTLAAKVRDREFREDLYKRLSLITLKIPPLRERREDVIPLVYHTILAERGEAGGEIARLDPEVRERLVGYPWPGNVRELQAAVREALGKAGGGKITRECLPGRITAAPQAAGAPLAAGAHERGADKFRGKSLKRFLREQEQEYVTKVMGGGRNGKPQSASS